MYEPKHLQLCAGEEWPDCYVAAGQHRDSDTLERSNFRSILTAIGGESNTVHVVRDGHWAVEWVEWIAIHADNEPALRIADGIAEGLMTYPIVNEDDWSELESDEAARVYKVEMAMKNRDRRHWLAEAPCIVLMGAPTTKSNT